MGVVFYAPLTTDKLAALRRLFAPFTSAGFSNRSRNYKGYTLYELSSPDGKEHFAYLLGEDYFVGSFSAFLIEDVIRTVAAGASQPYFDNRTQLRRLARAEHQDGTLYVSLAEAEGYWAKLWPRSDSLKPSTGARYLGAAAMLEAHLLKEQLFWSGYVTADESASLLLAGFSKNLPPEVPYFHQVPNGCAMLRCYGFRDAAQWNLQMQPLWRQQEAAVLERRLALFSRYGVDIEGLFAHVGHVAGLLQMEAPAGVHADRLFLLHLRSAGGMKTALRQIADRFSGQASDYQEQHRGHTIQYMALPDLPYLLLGEPFSGFSELFYTQRQDFLLASSSLLALKAALDQLENEESWGRTPAFQQQLSQEITNANVSVQVNLSKLWPKLGEELRYPWSAFFRQQALQGVAPCFFSVQLSVLEEKLYVQGQLYAPVLAENENWLPVQAAEESSPPAATSETATLPRAPAQAAGAIPPGYQKKYSYTFDSPLISKPLLVFDPVRRQFQAFAQEKKRLSPARAEQYRRKPLADATRRAHYQPCICDRLL